MNKTTLYIPASSSSGAVWSLRDGVWYRHPLILIHLGHPERKILTYVPLDFETSRISRVLKKPTDKLTVQHWISASSFCFPHGTACNSWLSQKHTEVVPSCADANTFHPRETSTWCHLFISWFLALRKPDRFEGRVKKHPWIILDP